MDTPSRNQFSGTALVVSPKQCDRRRILRWLRAAGYATLACGKFEQASRLASGHRPDLLVSAVRLGDYNGIQLAWRARFATPNTRVVVLADHRDRALKNEAVGCGAVFAESPISEQAFLSAVAGETPSLRSESHARVA